MSDNHNQPVPLPAGSFSYDELKAGLDKAAKGSAKAYDENIGKALETGVVFAKDADPRSIPGYEFKVVEREGLNVAEAVQVFNPKLAEQAEQADQEAASEAGTRLETARRNAEAVVAAGNTKE